MTTTVDAADSRAEERREKARDSCKLPTKRLPGQSCDAMCQRLVLLLAAVRRHGRRRRTERDCQQETVADVAGRASASSRHSIPGHDPSRQRLPRTLPQKGAAERDPTHVSNPRSEILQNTLRNQQTVTKCNQTKRTDRAFRRLHPAATGETGNGLSCQLSVFEQDGNLEMRHGCRELCIMPARCETIACSTSWNNQRAGWRKPRYFFFA